MTVSWNDFDSGTATYDADIGARPVIKVALALNQFMPWMTSMEDAN
jgi:hypothetical protein